MKETIPNDDIANALERIADLLEAQDANRFRVNAYRRAVSVIRDLDQSAAQLALSEKPDKLKNLPEIGKSIAGVIREYVHTGRIGLLERLEGQISAEDLFTTVPGIGEELARRIHRELDVDTLEDLELAAHDGRLERVAGIGHRRLKAIRDSLSGILSRSSRSRARRLRMLQKGSGEGAADKPSVETLLAVDSLYRKRAQQGNLKTITPRRFNPRNKAWLPILHTEKNGWRFTALYSNTARAHELGKIRDWVVIYYEQDGDEDQCTVVTEMQGSLKGRRVIRGREDECRSYYASRE